MKSTKNRDFAVYAILSSVVFLFAFLIVLTGESYYRPFFGPVHPLLVIACSALVGLAGLSILKKHAGIDMVSHLTARKGIVSAILAAMVFSIPVISADLLFRFPEDINVRLLEAFLFYPSIGFVAEITFHTLPLTVAFLLYSLRKSKGASAPPASLFLPAIVTEPLFQVIFSGDIFAATTLFTFFHVALISLFQIYLLRKYDFLTTYVFRVFYYLLWHILWGYLRLQLIF